MKTALLVAAAMFAVLPASEAAAQQVLLPTQQSIAGGVNVHAYTFDEGIGATSASLMLMPIAVQQPIGSSWLAEGYVSYARGTVEMDGETFHISAPTDTWTRLSYIGIPGTALTVGFNIPTGHPTHDSEEAVVATVLSTDILGFREASWGMGFAATGGISTAYQVGLWQVSVGASYRQNKDFMPRADTAVRYAPGSEMRGRLAFGRDIGETKRVTFGLMALNYSEDQLDGRNLFQAGPRVMVDGSYAFPIGRTSWSIFLADIWRGQGDVTLPIVSQASTVRKDSAYSIGNQNLIVAGVSGSIPVSQTLALRPGMDLRVQRGVEAGADGWMFSAGADFPLRAGWMEIFPAARLMMGQIQTSDLQMSGVKGLEFSLVLRRTSENYAPPTITPEPGR